MSTERPPSHEHLLTLANKVKAAAQDGDRHRVESTARALLQALVPHLASEAATLLYLPPGDARVLRRGQQRIVDTVLALVLAGAAPGSRYRCENLAQQLSAELQLQATDERRCFTWSGSGPRCSRHSEAVSAPLLGEVT